MEIIVKFPKYGNNPKLLNPKLSKQNSTLQPTSTIFNPSNHLQLPPPAAFKVFSNNAAIVINPTPPGTGVI